MKKLLQFFSYCGVSREEYLSVRKDAYVANFQVWKFLHAFMAVIFLISIWTTGRGDFLSADILSRVVMAVYSATIAVLFFTKAVPEDSLTGQLIIYLTMVSLLSVTMLVGLVQPELVCVSFVVMLVLLSVFMLDRPFYMAIVLSLAMVIYLLHATALKPEGLLLRTEVFTVLSYGVLGIAINTFYNGLRFRELLLSREAKDHLQAQQQAMEEQEQMNRVLQDISASLVEVLGDVVESRDSGNGDHVRRVRGYTNILANQVMEDLPEYGLTPHTISLMTFASSLHDVGKIAIPDTILLKPGKLTSEEFETMKTHCEKGCLILQKMSGSWSGEYLNMGLAICAAHHEKWDGKGYPKGLKGEEIPISAQIVSIADIYDALTTQRPYKEAYSPEKARSMILNGECGAFSEKLLQCFKKCSERFAAFAWNPDAPEAKDHAFSIIGTGEDAGKGYVVGFHDENHTLQENLKLTQEVALVNALSESQYLVCYVNMRTNDLIFYKTDPAFARILSSIDSELPPNRRFDQLLRTVIVSENLPDFLQATERYSSLDEIRSAGRKTVDFKIRLEDGIHHCRLKFTPDPRNPNAMILGIFNRDEEHTLEKELNQSRQAAQNLEQLQEQLAVIDSISAEYDYVCALNADTMEPTVYRAAPWITDMVKDLNRVVSSPEFREKTMKSFIYPEDFPSFLESSLHSHVVEGLKEGRGLYTVNYRAYKFGRLIRYQTRYSIDPGNSQRIIIGLRSLENI